MATKNFTVWLSHTGRENIGECPECHFDSLERFTFAMLAPTGVTTFEKDVCPRCRDIARTEDR